MSRLASRAAVLATLLGLTLASAQDRDQNPLERRRPPPAAVDEPAWVGVFVDDSGELVAILFRDAAGAGFDGVLVEQSRERGRLAEHSVRGTVQGGKLAGAVAGRWAFTGSVEAEGALVLVSGTTTHRLRRTPGTPRSSAELRDLVVTPREGRVPGNEAAAIGALKTLDTAQALFRQGDKEQDDRLDYGTLEELGRVGLIDALLASGTKQGYRFECRPSPTTPELLWMATATPIEPGVTGARAFFTNHTGVVYASTDGWLFAWNDECKPPEGATPVGQERRRAPAQKGPDLSGVKVGQRYAYAMTNAGAPPMEMVYEVVRVGEGSVEYRVSAYLDMGQGLQPVGEPTPQEWRFEAVDGEPGVPEGSRRERLTVSGVELDCLVTRSGGSTTWVIMSGDVPIFPLVARVETDGKAVLELERIE